MCCSRRKSTHALTLLNEDGFLLSNDINYTRALELSKNIENGVVKCFSNFN